MAFCQILRSQLEKNFSVLIVPQILVLISAPTILDNVNKIAIILMGVMHSLGMEDLMEAVVEEIVEEVVA